MTSGLPPRPDPFAARLRRLWTWFVVAAGVMAVAIVGSMLILVQCLTFFGEQSPCGDVWWGLVLMAWAVALVGVVTAAVCVVRLVIAYRARSSHPRAGSSPSG